MESMPLSDHQDIYNIYNVCVCVCGYRRVKEMRHFGNQWKRFSVSYDSENVISFARQYINPEQHHNTSVPHTEPLGEIGTGLHWRRYGTILQEVHVFPVIQKGSCHVLFYISFCKVQWKKSVNAIKFGFSRVRRHTNI